MPKTSAAPRAATLKQAKAAFKARGNPTLSEREKKQLQRSIDLDKRAFAAREREKRKAELAKDKSEKERKRKEAVEQVRLGTQRRRDKFGYASSQFHLGAFFGKPAVEQLDGEENASAEPENAEFDMFGEDDVDDESLLEGLGSPACDRRSNTIARSGSAAMPPPARPPAPKCHNNPHEPFLEDFESFFDELGSSTQIARELEQALPAPTQRNKSLTKADSFGSGDFDLSMEDIAELDRTSTEEAKRELDRQKMPPPVLTAAMKRPAAAKKSSTRTHTPSSTKPRPTILKRPRLSKEELKKRVWKYFEVADDVDLLRGQSDSNPRYQPALPALSRDSFASSKPPAHKTTKVHPSSREDGMPGLFSHVRGFRGMMPRPRIGVEEVHTEAAPCAHPCINQQQATALSKQSTEPSRIADIGFSLAQLEDFVDDDLQLTQMDRG